MKKTKKQFTLWNGTKNIDLCIEHEGIKYCTRKRAHLTNAEQYDRIERYINENISDSSN